MPGQDSCRVSWSSSAIAHLKEPAPKAQAAGKGEDLLRILRSLQERLVRDPVSLGEVYRSRGEIEVHLAVRGFLAIDFAIDKERKFVLVRACTALSFGE